MSSHFSNSFNTLLVKIQEMKKRAPAPPVRRHCILSALFVITFISVLAALNEISFDTHFHFIAEFGKCALSSKSQVTAIINETTASSVILLPPEPLMTASDEEDELRIFIGIMTLPKAYDRRHFLRLIYGTQTLKTNARVDVKFVFCNLTDEDQQLLISLEIMMYNDIMILNCTENMNNGKTYTYFSSLPSIFESNPDYPQTPPYNYVMKADDDIYIRLESLIASLQPLPREDLYYGYVIPCSSMDPFKHYMAGMGYLVSWDLVKWIAESDIPKTHLDGPEDRTFGQWIQAGRRGKNRFNAKWSMYDYPEPKTACTHKLWNDTVAVHRLKNQEKWVKTLRFFNVTKELKPSRLYHIP